MVKTIKFLIVKPSPLTPFSSILGPNVHLRINNLREKFSPGPGIEPGSPALRAGAITTKPLRRSAGPS